MKSKMKENLQNRIQGWLPREPKLPGKYAGDRAEKKQSFLDKPISQLSPDVVLGWALGFLLILVGIVGFIFNDWALGAVQSVAILLPAAGLVGYFFGFWLGIAAIILLVVLAANHTITGARLKRNFTKRRLLPYGVTAILFAVAYLYSGTALQFSYAIPVAFVVSGILVIKGLKKFAITLPAFGVLLISMLVLGCVMAGPTVVTYSSETRSVAFSQIPRIDAINITARSVEGDVRLYFDDNSSEACHIQWIKEYGVVTVGSGTDYNSPSTYAEEPAPVFYYSVTDGTLYVICDSYMTLMNITVNRNLLGNFSLYTYFGDVSADVPANVGSVQTLNLTSILATSNLKISNTTNLLYADERGGTVDANIASEGQTSDSAFQLNGSNVYVNLQASNVRSQITAHATSPYGGIMKTNVQGFQVLSKSSTYFQAQTPNYGDAAQHKLDILANGAQSEGEPTVSVTASYKEK